MKKGSGYKGLAFDDPEFPHGQSTTGYQYGCRCEICVKANSDYRKEWRKRTEGKERNKTGRVMGQGHGTRACYLRGCKRDECRAAAAKYERDRQARLREDPWVRQAMEM